MVSFITNFIVLLVSLSQTNLIILMIIPSTILVIATPRTPTPAHIHTAQFYGLTVIDLHLQITLKSAKADVCKYYSHLKVNNILVFTFI